MDGNGGSSFFVLQIFPLSCDLLELTGLVCAAIAFCAPLRRWHGIAVDVLTSVSLLSSAALQISIFDLSLVVSLKFLLKLTHSSLDSHVRNVVSFFESVEEFKLGIVFLVLVLVEVQSTSRDDYLYCS